VLEVTVLNVANMNMTDDGVVQKEATSA